MNDIFNPSAAIIMLDGKPHMKDARGALVPLETVKPMDKLQDEVVRKVVGFARALSQQISRFKGHTFEDIGALLALMEQQYGAKPGGKKGNMTFTSFDGCLKLQVAVADNIIFGAELQIAKSLIDECLKEWGAELAARTARHHHPRLPGGQGGPGEPGRAVHADARRDRGPALETGHGSDPQLHARHRLEDLLPFL